MYTISAKKTQYSNKTRKRKISEAESGRLYGFCANVGRSARAAAVKVREKQKKPQRERSSGGADVARRAARQYGFCAGSGTGDIRWGFRCAARVMFGEGFGARGGNAFLGGGGISGRAVPSDLAKAETGVVRQPLRCAHQPRDFAFFERSAAAGKAKLGGKSAPSFVGTGENVAYQRVFFVFGNN